MLLDILDDDDRVVDDEADGEHHREKRQRIDGKTKRNEGNEGRDHRHGHGQHRDQRRAPVLQEDEHDDKHDQKRLDKGLYDLRQRCGDELRVVDDLGIGHVRREVFLRRLDNLLDIPDGLQRVGVVGQHDRETDGSLAVRRGLGGNLQLTGRDAGNVSETHEGAILSGLDDDALEILRRREAALHDACVLTFLRIRGGHHAHRAAGSLHVLVPDSVHHVGNRDIELGNLVRVQPDAHRVIGGEDVDVADAVYALDLVDQVNVEVVFDEIPVEAAVRRRNRADQRHVLGRFFRRDAVGSDFGRKAGRCDGDVVLHQHRVHVAVGAQLEIDVQRIFSAVVRG